MLRGKINSDYFVQYSSHFRYYGKIVTVYLHMIFTLIFSHKEAGSHCRKTACSALITFTLKMSCAVGGYL